MKNRFKSVLIFICLSSIAVSCKSNDTQFNPELRNILNQIAAKEFILFENNSDKQYEFCINKKLDSTVQSGGFSTLFHKNLIVNTDDGESFFSVSKEKDIDSFYYGYVEFLDVMGEIDLNKLLAINPILFIIKDMNGFTIPVIK